MLLNSYQREEEREYWDSEREVTDKGAYDKITWLPVNILKF